MSICCKKLTNIIFHDDQAYSSIKTISKPFTGTFRPQQKFSSFQEPWATGIWTLELKKAQKKGSLNDWKLEFFTYNPHGTPVAGIAAAPRNNGIGGSGVAPEAFLAGLRLIADEITDEQIADALSHKTQEIDIFNNSWRLVDPLYAPAMGIQEMKKGAEQGRGGLGNLYVWAAGNDGKQLSHVNYNGLANSRYAIAVGAIDLSGEKTKYSETGSSILVSTYSSGHDADGSPSNIVSTDLVGTDGYSPVDDQDAQNNYTDKFGGTSAAAPVVSGVIALMLEANPNLTWRDVQHILVKTASQNNLGTPYSDDSRRTNTEWQQNGAGLWVNQQYGFGAINAEAAVKEAINWTPVAKEDLADSILQNVNKKIPNGTTETGLESTVNIDKDITVEKAEVILDIDHQEWRDLKVVLTSPDGTQSLLTNAIPPKLREGQEDVETTTRNDKNYPSQLKSWTFTSVHHWGESSKGEWKLQVFDVTGNAIQGEWKDWKLNLYGTKPIVNVTATDAIAIENGDEGTFNLTRTGNVKYDLPVNYSVAGTATNGQDYQQITSSVVIPAGQNSVTLPIKPINDTEVEGEESVVVTIAANDTYEVGIDSNAAVSIYDIVVPPELQSANTLDGTTTITGTLMGLPNTILEIEFFSASDTGEGETLLGSQFVPTDSAGKADFTMNLINPVMAGEFITATATDPTNTTSGFSEILEVTGENIPVNSWNAKFINRTVDTINDRASYDFTNPVAVMNLGDRNQGLNDGKIRFYQNWGAGSPTNEVQTDNFAMQAWTRTNFEAGELYKITTRSDDGTWFMARNVQTGEWITNFVDSENGGYWNRTAFPDRTIFFKVPESGEYDFYVQYHEVDQTAKVDVTLEKAEPFYNFVDGQEATNWKSTVYWWDRKLGNVPPTNFNADPNNVIGVFNQGANTRADGSPGIDFNIILHQALNNDINFPDDNFAIDSSTQVNLESGVLYQAQARADDGFQLLAQPVNGGQVINITPANQWQQAYGNPQTVTFTVPTSGVYDLHFLHYEERGDAYLNLSWKPLTFNGKVTATIGAFIRSGPGRNFPIVDQKQLNQELTFDRWVKGEYVGDYLQSLGKASDLWYRLAGTTDQWISAAIVTDEPAFVSSNGVTDGGTVQVSMGGGEVIS